MAVKIRLTRIGKKQQPAYRVVVADSRGPRDGRYIEQIGRYDPRQEPSLVEIDAERAAFWLARGAQPSPQAKKLIEIASGTRPVPVRAAKVHVIGEPAPAATEAAPVVATKVVDAVEEAVPLIEDAAQGIVGEEP